MARDRWLKYLLVLDIVILATVFVLFKLNSKVRNASSFISSTPTPTPTLQASEKQQNTGSLEKVILNSLGGADGTYGIAVINLRNSETSYINGHRSFGAASLYKLWVMVTAYRQIQAGTLSKDDILSEDVSLLNEIFSVDKQFEIATGTVTLTVRDALKEMITVSDNYSALLLSEKVGFSAVSSFLSEYGFDESSMGALGGSPSTTAYDTALFFEKLYRGELANEQYSHEMLGLLKSQQLNDEIPKYLPSNVVVAHKTGIIDNFLHDAGIVYAPKGDYIIAILSESASSEDLSGKIAELSKAVYDYLNF